MSGHRYGEFEQVNGATVNAALDRAEKAEKQRDQLLEEIKSIRDMTDADDPDSYRSDDREGCLDTVFGVANEAVARLEDEAIARMKTV
jgi:hypothetical protein